MGAESRPVFGVKEPNDQIRRARELVERSNEALRRSSTPFSEAYLNGHVKIALRCTSGHLTNYGILLEARPYGNNFQSATVQSGIHDNRVRSGISGQKAPMLPRLVEVVEFKQMGVPSIPRFERFDDSDVGYGKSLYLFKAPIFGPERGFVSGNGEIHIFGPRMAVALGERDGENVQTAPDTMDDRSGVGAQDEWYRLYIAEAEKVLAGLRIDITEDCKRITFLPVCSPPLQIWEIGFGPLDSGFSL
jgi:hypothetical protein